MNALWILIVSFAMVFLLGIQQFNVTAHHMLKAAITSAAISAAAIVQFKLLPGPTSWLDITAFFVGNSAGIVASIWLYPRLFNRSLATPNLPPPCDGAVRLGETLRLGITIADDAALSHITSLCVQKKTTDNVTWWDTTDVHTEDAGDINAVEISSQYLHLRGQLIHHESLRQLVRFIK